MKKVIWLSLLSVTALSFSVPASFAQGWGFTPSPGFDNTPVDASTTTAGGGSVMDTGGAGSSGEVWNNAPSTDWNFTNQEIDSPYLPAIAPVQQGDSVVKHSISTNQSVLKYTLTDPGRVAGTAIQSPGPGRSFKGNYTSGFPAGLGMTTFGSRWGWLPDTGTPCSIGAINTTSDNGKF